MPYEPFPIFDIRRGEYNAREPWISPEQSFRDLQNCFVYRGRLLSRPGYRSLAPIIINTSVAGDDLMGPPWTPYPVAGLFQNIRLDDTIITTDKRTPIAPRTPGGNYGISVVADFTPATRVSDNAVSAGNPGDGILRHDSTGTIVGNVNYVTGVLNLDYRIIGVTSPVNVIVTWQFTLLDTADRPDGQPAATTNERCQGMFRFEPRSSSNSLLAATRRYLVKWNEGNGEWGIVETPIGAGDELHKIWNSEVENLVHTASMTNGTADALVMVNGLDPLMYYDGSRVLEVNTDWVTPGNTPPEPGRDTDLDGITDPFDTDIVPGTYDRQVESALLCFYHKERLVLLYTREGGAAQPQRARWSRVSPVLSTSASWDPADWRDAPTSRKIVSAERLGEDLIVFFEEDETWRLRWRDDFRQPFEWQRMPGREGSRATLSTVRVADTLQTVGPTGLSVTDGSRVIRGNPQIPDEVLAWDSDSVKLAYGELFDQHRQVWFAHATPNSPRNDRVLVRQVDDNAWSHFDLPMSAMEQWKATGSSETWDTAVGAWDDPDVPWDYFLNLAGYPAMVFVDENLFAWQYGNAETDQVYGQVDEVDSTNVYSRRAQRDRLIPVRATTQNINPYKTRQARLGWVDLICSASERVTLTCSFYKGYGAGGGAPRTVRSTRARPYKTVRVSLSPSVQRTYGQLELSSLGSDKVFRRIRVNHNGSAHRMEIKALTYQRFAIDAMIWYFKPGRRLSQERS